MAVTLGFLGFGEVGYYMAKGLKTAGFGRIVAFDKAAADGGPFARTIGSRAEEAGVELVSSLQDMLGLAEVVVSALPAKYSLSAAREAAGYTTAARLFVDVSTAKPRKRGRWNNFLTEWASCLPTEPCSALFPPTGTLFLFLPREAEPPNGRR
jgi:3-hydroxyisobutyrate dehydrogenase-like beta-hydroxyacid dehydrogenase